MSVAEDIQPHPPNLTFVCITDPTNAKVNDADNNNVGRIISARYTKSSLRRVFHAMGCKPRLAEKVCSKVFLILQQRVALGNKETYSLAHEYAILRPGVGAVTLRRDHFERLVLESFNVDTMVTMQLRTELRVSTSLHECKISVILILCGTSGTGKTTLASLLASRLGIPTVISTDSIRHLLRSLEISGPKRKDSVKDSVLWASTYQSSLHEYIDQSELVMKHVELLVEAYESRRESIIIEGVHATPEFAARIVTNKKSTSSVLPFMVYISNEMKHLERFAVRAKAMSLRPDGNRYVANLQAIRSIQSHLCMLANGLSVPQVDNTNVDRSVATIHATVLACLRRKIEGGDLFEESCGRFSAINEEYVRCKSKFWSGSDVLALIRQKHAAQMPGSPPSTSAASTSLRQGPIEAAGGELQKEETSFYESGSSYGSDEEVKDPESVRPFEASPHLLLQSVHQSRQGHSLGPLAGQEQLLKDRRSDLGSLIETEEVGSEDDPSGRRDGGDLVSARRTA
jgi:2-phosphoglycerate kinase